MFAEDKTDIETENPYLTLGLSANL